MFPQEGWLLVLWHSSKPVISQIFPSRFHGRSFVRLFVISKMFGVDRPTKNVAHHYHTSSSLFISLIPSPVGQCIIDRRRRPCQVDATVNKRRKIGHGGNGKVETSWGKAWIESFVS